MILGARITPHSETAVQLSLSELNTMTSPLKSNAGPKYRRIEFVAERLDLSVRSVQRLIASGQLPAFKIGGAVRVSDADLEQLIARSRVRKGEEF